jgi:hypothetical protein
VRNVSQDISSFMAPSNILGARKEPPEFDTTTGASLGQPAPTVKGVMTSWQGVVADVGFPAGLASTDELLGGGRRQRRGGAGSG